MANHWTNYSRNHPFGVHPGQQDMREAFLDVPAFHGGSRPNGRGWRIDGRNYPDTNDILGPGSNWVVTRPSDYVPYQSLGDTSGRHGYNPAARQYPQTAWSEAAAGLRVETPTDRINAWGQTRPNHMLPGGPDVLHASGVANGNGDPTRLLYPTMHTRLRDPVQMLRAPDGLTYHAQAPWR